ncbi:60S ribosomal protein L26, partial [Galemys pyrenaicus]
MVQVVQGNYKGQQIGKVVQVHQEKGLETSVHTDIHLSKILAMRLKMEKDRRKIPQSKATTDIKN